MYFPKHWMKAAIDGPNRLGVQSNVEAWGWSDVSDEDALQKAEARARAVLARIPCPKMNRDAYYENRPFREPILQEISQKPVYALITRNSFGCEVLNTDCAIFADLDYLALRVAFFARLFDFGGKKAAIRKQEWENQTLEKLRSWRKSNSSWSFRAYRTSGGLRLLVTSKILQAGTAEADQWLQAVGNDPLYQKLCRNQKSFRARLSPKPWRCNLRQLKIAYPWDTPQKESAAKKWLEKYQQVSKNYAVCAFLETIGSASVLDELKSIVALHDTRTSVSSALPLA